MACAVNTTESAAPLPLFHHICRPKISQAQNGFSRLTRPVFRRQLPVQHIAWTASTTNMDGLPTSCSPLPYCSTPISYITFSHNLLSIIGAHPRIIFNLHASVPISGSFLGSTLQSSPIQAGCRRSNPSNAALPSVVRLLPTFSVTFPNG